ncbi:MAG: tRNA (N6-isopentenyl adenosine(37)-C2)-methylthiotransferase MiaB [Candidatus Improbicoccus devescovinae]|nr:MAG: tRNA (N6-isopentenyl adenosine(37)-C2)-methylthiotransferase MiaB [Candidatus Improbicoccus devescovinae]
MEVYDYIDIIQKKVKTIARFVNYIAYIKVFGCQQNEADADKIRGFLSKIGFKFCSNPCEAEVIIFNTCAVRHTAENRIFGHIGELKKIKKINPKVLIFVCGCMVEQEHVRQKIEKNYSFVDMIFGPSMLDRFPLIFLNLIDAKNCDFNEKKNLGFRSLSGFSEKHVSNFKAFVPIISGCNNFCSYCIVPYVRGPEKSRNLHEILDKIKKLVSDGFKDITLLGQNVNSYGNDFGADSSVNFSVLLNKISDINGDFLLRFTTSHPKDFTDELIYSIAKNKHFCKHIHLPVQSGSNRILNLMNRKYTREKYLDIIHKIKCGIPDIFITTDIIVGFPGETENDFNDTMSLVEFVRFSSIFNFIYSPRRGTLAEKFQDDIPREEKVCRIKKLILLQNQISLEVLNKNVGKNVKVLVEKHEENLVLGRLSNNINVHICCSSGLDSLLGKFVYVKITGVNHGFLIGKML